VVDFLDHDIGGLLIVRPIRISFFEIGGEAFDGA
jgi:hypothetical protein